MTRALVELVGVAIEQPAITRERRRGVGQQGSEVRQASDLGERHGATADRAMSVAVRSEISGWVECCRRNS
ncbi:hypothetical protein [Streptomyces sp. NPDC050704]|uniref:hypothetical protein n=1 Tax=Streptomyces sp. NPDC050704 TaxID=3157219 RepID=UPI003447E22B